MTVREEFAAQVGDDGFFNLAAHKPDATRHIDGKSEAKEGLAEAGDELFDWHEKLFAEGERSLLLVLQGTDASGKNGTIKHVVRLVNPAGVRISSFTEPTEEEQEHHFLWRIRKGLPGPGVLGVFDRSHYEDVLVPMAEQTLPAEDIEQRFKDIIEFEQELTDGGMTVVKCLLHLSYDEQRERFLRRLRRDDKQWKFNNADLETRRYWDAYQAAYGEMVAKTSTSEAPWYVIPSDHKWYRNWAIARLLIEVLEDMNPDYPQTDLDVEALRAQLEADA